MIKIAIIGAGLSGLTVATSLNNHADITIFEKSRGFGGRIATRHAEQYYFDHGAQFFTVKTDAFKQFLKPMIDRKIIEPWNARFVEIENKKITTKRVWSSNFPHYVGAPAMNAIGKFLSQSLDIKLNTKVSSIKETNRGWSLAQDTKELGHYDWVIVTTPPKQALEILPDSLDVRTNIEKVKMSGCYSLMLGFSEELALGFDAALVKGEDISWISVNSAKPGRNEAACLLVHSTNIWADNHLEMDSKEAIEHLTCCTQHVLGTPFKNLTHQAIHRWRYANIGKQQGPTHYINKHVRLALCGDWFIQGRIEAAFTSGQALARELVDIL